jgi:hypothetical protein
MNVSHPSSGWQVLVFLRSALQFLLTANGFPISPILVTLVMEALGSYETSVLTRATRRSIPEDGILHGSLSVLRREKGDISCVGSLSLTLPSSCRTLGSWVWISLETWMLICYYSVFVLSCMKAKAFRRPDPSSRRPSYCIYYKESWKAGRLNNGLL